jgi:hypothetical protein
MEESVADLNKHCKHFYAYLGVFWENRGNWMTGSRKNPAFPNYALLTEQCGADLTATLYEDLQTFKLHVTRYRRYNKRFCHEVPTL